MRFSSSLLFACAVALSTSTVSVNADLRMASQPRQAFKVKDRNAVNFVTETAIYMEPSDFAYQGLKNQRQQAYDNFLRSNIDNEQDNRNFANEAGQDMLPFRSLNAAATDAGGDVQTKIGTTLGGAMNVTPGVKTLVPLRWNNPHASELEVNIWIAKNQVVVPVMLPTCSGEGHQDNVFEFIVPTDFLQLPAKVAGFTGCKAIGDCVLQVYAHSVETRQYAIGTPIIIPGDYVANTATTNAAVKPAPIEVGTDISKLRPLCLNGGLKQSDIASAVPQVARLISDVYNHAYQNSDYSPYSGQQPLAISQNMQAAAILSMTTGNRGELGKAALDGATKNLAAQLQNKQKNLIKQYEGVTNKIINAITATVANGATMTLGANNDQKLAKAFRSEEVGSVTTTRLQTNTYVPSFVITNQAALATATTIVKAAGAKYAKLLDTTAAAGPTVGIYVATLKDMAADFKAAAAKGVTYLPAALKATTATLADEKQFKKRTANNGRDNGQYATAQAAAAYAIRQPALVALGSTAAIPKALPFDQASDFPGDTLPIQVAGFDVIGEQTDPNGIMTDDACDSDDTPKENIDLTTGQPIAGKCAPSSTYVKFGNEESTWPVDENGIPIKPTTAPTGSASSNTINTMLISLISCIAIKFIKA